MLEVKLVREYQFYWDGSGSADQVEIVCYLKNGGQYIAYCDECDALDLAELFAVRCQAVVRFGIYYPNTETYARRMERMAIPSTEKRR